MKKGDTVTRNAGEFATVTYVDLAQDYVELRYHTGWCFRSTASEWKVVGP